MSDTPSTSTQETLERSRTMECLPDAVKMRFDEATRRIAKEKESCKPVSRNYASASTIYQRYLAEKKQMEVEQPCCSEA